MNDFDLLMPVHQEPHDRWRWATVEDITPLSIRFDGDTTVFPVTITLIDGSTLSVGDRVWCQLFGLRVIVLGVGGGGGAPSPFVATDIPSGADLNTYVNPGVYNQPSNVWAGTGTHYPAAHSGQLEVSVTHGGQVYQRYTEYQAYNNVWSRGKDANGWGLWALVGPSLRRGPAAFRGATVPAYWDMWQDTDGTQKLYVGNKSGGWRQFSGEAVDPAAAWAASSVSGAVSNYGRTPIFTLPTILETNETLLVTPTSVGSGFGVASMAALTRGASNTTVSMRFTQMFSATTQALVIAWQIVQT